MTRRRPTPLTPLGSTAGFDPTRQRPVRVRARTMPADTHFEPHSHTWAQLAYCATGVLQVTAASSEEPGREVAYIVPPSRAVWIAPGLRHAVHALEDAWFRTIYLHASVTPPGWDGCRVIVVSPLLRELIHALDTAPAGTLAGEREAHLAALTLDEITQADPQSLGVPLPPAQAGDKRLRALCEAVLREPGDRAPLEHQASRVGASERTMARLFREGLGMSWQQWRQQVTLAHALPLLARGMAVSQVAAASGYASESAFTAMFKAAMGQPPSRFQGKNSL